MVMKIELDFRSPISLTEQIVEQIRHQIASGVLNPGEQLPTVRSLATELRINFNTVARAYRILDEMGLISTQQGRGTYVTEIPPPESGEKLRRETLDALTRRYLDEARQLGFSKNEIEQVVSNHLQSWSESR
jgi:GntR family transcriptional regulator